MIDNMRLPSKRWSRGAAFIFIHSFITNSLFSVVGIIFDMAGYLLINPTCTKVIIIVMASKLYS